MVTSSESDSLVDQYTRQLGIKWRVVSEMANVDRPQILSSPEDGEHHILFPSNYAARGKAQNH